MKALNEKHKAKSIKHKAKSQKSKSSPWFWPMVSGHTVSGTRFWAHGLGTWFCSTWFCGPWFVHMVLGTWFWAHGFGRIVFEDLLRKYSNPNFRKWEKKWPCENSPIRPVFPCFCALVFAFVRPCFAAPFDTEVALRC